MSKTKLQFNKFKQLLNESDNRLIGYHCTNINPEIIIRDGFKVGSDGFTDENMFEDLYKKFLPEIPVFVTFKKPWSDSAKYTLKLDLTGLKLYPDFGSLVDTGAYYDYDFKEKTKMFYWEHWSDITNPKLVEFLEDFGDDDPILYPEDLSGEDSKEVLDSACVSGEGLNKRIISIKTN